MTSSTETRFIIITHNPITMARMNRLFGVTMAERGVSQLVSVDLDTAEQARLAKHFTSNPAAFDSASHGAGRRMSRGVARRTVTEDELRAAADEITATGGPGSVLYEPADVTNDTALVFGLRGTIGM